MAIVFSCLLVGWIAYISGHNSSDDTHRSNEYEQAAKRNAEVACGNLPSAAIADCIYNEISSARQQHQSEQDLDAQQWMALWAGVLVIVTVFTTFISFIALRYLRDTFKETASMTSEARKAGNAALIAANEAIKANEIAKQNVAIQNRAWLTITPPKSTRNLQDRTTPFIITLQFRNTGNTPAIRVSSFCAMISVVAGDQLPEFQFNQAMAEQNNSVSGAIGNGQLAEVQPIAIPARDFFGMQRGEVDIYMHARVAYFDIFDSETERISEYTARLTVIDNDRTDVHMIMKGRQNSSS